MQHTTERSFFRPGNAGTHILHIVFAVVALALIVAGCERFFAQEDEAEDVEPVVETPASGAAFEEPFLRFAFGTIELERDQERLLFDVGERAASGDIVRVPAGAVAELQYADAALLRIDGPASAEVHTREARDGRPGLELRLIDGSVIVRRDPEKTARFVRVITDSGVVNTEATGYMVSREETGETLVSVATGRVRVLPSGIDPEELSDLTDVEELLTIIEEISETSVFVDADGEVVIRPEDVETTTEILRDMRDELARTGTTERPDPEKIETISALLRYARGRISATLPEVRSADPGRISGVRELAERPLLSVDERSPDPPGSALSRLRVVTDPPDAEVLLDGLAIGSEIFSSLFEPGETVTLTIRRRGYETEEVEVTFEPELDKEISVELSRLEPTIGDEAIVQAIRDGDAQVVEEYLRTGGDPNATVAGEYDVLSIAFGAGLPIDELMAAFDPDLEIVELLLDAGADPDTVFGSADAPDSTLTPLSSVILSGLFRDSVDYQIIDLLLSAGATPDIVMETGEMRVTALALPIIIGIENGRVETELVERLLEAGSDASITVVYEGRLLSPLATALALGADHGYDPADVVRLLADAGARVEQRVRIDGTIWTPLRFAESAGLRESAEVLRDFGA